MNKNNFVIFVIVLFVIVISVILGWNDSAVGASVAESESFLPVVYSSEVFRPPIPTPPPDAFDWPMAGANVERTSWISEEVRGSLKPEWYSHFEAYISQKVQIIAAGGFLYISASDGLHALSAENGAEIWFYPTSLPLGHSPTYHDGVVYVGGMDKMIHAVDGRTGQRLWTFEAEAGFHTNPLIVNGMLFAGNRDGNFYAVFTEGSRKGELAWKYKTGAPILYSAAYKDNSVYFASNDMHAYALNAQTGEVEWISDKLSGSGFNSFWPVVYGELVIFSGTWNYRLVPPGPSGSHNVLERLDVYPSNASPDDPIGPYGTEPGTWAPGTTTIDAYRIIDYFEEKPQRRTFFALNRSNGDEYTFDSDQDGKPEYAPILYYGAVDGTRYPPAVGADGVIYQANNYIYEDWITRGQVSGWKIGTQYISIPSPTTNAVDEALAFSIGGDIVYTRLCCEREAKAFDLTTGENWYYYDQGGRPLRRTLPDLYALGWDFAYWKVGDQSAPVPYNGRVYMINNNAVVAFSPNGLDPVIPYVEDLGTHSGERAEDIEKSNVATGLNTKVTLDNNSWPLLIQQERYYEQSPNPSARPTFTRLFEVAGSESGAPTSLSSENTGIVTKLTSTFGGQSLKTWVSRRSPTNLFHNTNNFYQLRGNLVGVAYSSGGSIRIVNNDTTIQGGEIDESWLLVWDDTDEHRWIPLIISLQNRPGQIKITQNSLTLSFSGGAGYLGVTPLYGMSAPLSGEASSWFGGIPSQTIERIRSLNRAARYFPEDCTETRSISSGSGDAVITYSYQYIQIQDDWNTAGFQIAYLPTTTALAAWNGSPILVNNQSLGNHVDFNYVTPLGRVAGVANTDTVTVLLPGIANYWRNYHENPANIDANDPLLIKLIAEIDKMVIAGHLRPGYGVHGIWDAMASSGLGQNMADYYHNPAETYYTLLSALPLLPLDVQKDVKEYLRDEYQKFPPYEVSHVGWDSGSSRDFFDLPPEVDAERSSFDACDVCNSWGFPGENIYASYLYAQNIENNAASIFAQVSDKLSELPDYSQSFPHRLNSNIIGYIGFLRLAQLANITPQSAIENKMVDLLVARAALTKYASALEATGFEYGGYKWSVRTTAPNQPDSLFTPRIIGTLWSQMPLYGFPMDVITGLSGGHTGGGYSFGIDYFSLVPELAAFLGEYSYSEVQDSVDDYAIRAPFWFVAKAQELGGEGSIMPIYDIVSLFQAKALILGESRSELEPFLDVPTMKVGDLYYMLNLVATLKSNP